ncbi:hypothetical protein ACHZ97_04190 [Lysobacter soli]|uniref:hypothetical protein n=1 Tax=Lysobacter soli TaxID=453783 RepID=UPI0037CA9E89
MTKSILDDARFDRLITLRDAYRVMERFAQSYRERGDTPISDFLDCYASETGGGLTSDPAAPDDFANAAVSVLGKR